MMGGNINRLFDFFDDPGPAQVFPEANVQRPMKFVFDIPMESSGLGDPFLATHGVNRNQNTFIRD